MMQRVEAVDLYQLTPLFLHSGKGDRELQTTELGPGCLGQAFTSAQMPILGYLSSL